MPAIDAARPTLHRCGKTPAIIRQRLCHLNDRRLTVQKSNSSRAMCWDLEKFSLWDVRKLSNLGGLTSLRLTSHLNNYRFLPRNVCRVATLPSEKECGCFVRRGLGFPAVNIGFGHPPIFNSDHHGNLLERVPLRFRFRSISLSWRHVTRCVYRRLRARSFYLARDGVLFFCSFVPLELGSFRRNRWSV